MRRFHFEFPSAFREDNLVALKATAPSGEELLVWAEVSLGVREIVLRQLAIWGVNIGPNEFGVRLLRQAAQDFMEEFDVDTLRIVQARRTSGAHPQRSLQDVVIRRTAR